MAVKRLGKRCQYEGCAQPAEMLATGRDYFGRAGIPLDSYCKTHAYVAADEGHPEYTVDCPNCGCLFGVN